MRFNLLLEGISGLCVFFERNRQRDEGRAVCDSLVERLENNQTSGGSFGFKLIARALAWGAFFNMRLGNKAGAHQLLQKCLSTLGNKALVNEDTRFEEVMVYLTLPFVMQDVSPAECKRLSLEAIELFKSVDEPWWVAKSISRYGSVVATYAIDEDVEPYLRELLDIQRNLGDLTGLADTLIGGSYGPASSFQFEQAEQMLSEALAISTELNDRFYTVAAAGHLGWQWIWNGRFEDARALYRQTLAAHGDLDYSESHAFVLQAHLGYPDLYLGEYKEAEMHALHTLDLTKQAKHYETSYWKALSFDILGKIALAKGSYEEAENYFQESLQIFQTYVSEEKICGILACLGFVSTIRNQYSRAQQLLYNSLEKAIEMTAVFELGHAITGISLLLADLGDEERAVNYYLSATTMGVVANSRWFADIAGNQISDIAERLPEDVLKAARSHPRKITSWEVPAEMLIELKELGWGKVDQKVDLT